MAYPGSRSHTWVAGERVDASTLNAWAPPNVAWGQVAAPVSASPTNSNIGGSFVDASGVTLTFTRVSGRQYKATLTGVAVWGTSSGSNEYGEIQLRDGSNNGLAAADFYGNNASANGRQSFVVIALFTGSGSFTVKGSAAVVAGSTGRLTLTGTWNLVVEDIGPSSP